jgi:hypothetical protein
MSCVMQFQFHERIAQLVYTFPEDATTSTGALFWSAPKRFPQPLTFNPADPSHVAFAQAGAILKAQVHNITIPAWGSDLDKVRFSHVLLLVCPSELPKLWSCFASAVVSAVFKKLACFPLESHCRGSAFHDPVCGRRCLRRGRVHTNQVILAISLLYTCV